MRSRSLAARGPSLISSPRLTYRRLTNRRLTRCLTDRTEPNVQALFDAALRQQLQGPPCAGAVERALSRHRDRHSERREPHAGFSRKKSQRTGAAGIFCEKIRRAALAAQ